MDFQKADFIFFCSRYFFIFSQSSGFIVMFKFKQNIFQQVINFKQHFRPEMLALWVIIVTAVLAIISIFLLLKSSSANKKKQMVLLIVGILIFISILISNFKSRHIFQQFSSLVTSSRNKQQQQISELFMGKITTNDKQMYSSTPITTTNYFLKKYQNIDENVVGDELFNNNYGNVEIKRYLEKIIYVSQKGDGASFFMHELASKLRNLGIPTFYVKLEFGGKEFLTKTGFQSYSKFMDSIRNYIQNNKIPYILVDNAQNLPCEVWNQILRHSHQLNMILNTEKLSNLIDKISQSPIFDGESHTIQQFLLSFQFRNWRGPSNNMLKNMYPSNFNIIPNQNINFHTLSQMKDGLTGEEISLKMSNSYNIIASHFGVQHSYAKIKRLIEGKGLNIIKSTKQTGGRSTQINRSIQGGVFYSTVKKTGINLQDFKKLEQIGLIELNNGIVYLN